MSLTGGTNGALRCAVPLDGKANPFVPAHPISLGRRVKTLVETLNVKYVSFHI
nr:MAG TPA: hypothetical protein [Caudoviricetes sp.]